MYNINFYTDKNGRSNVLDYINELELKSKNNKRARTKLDKINQILSSLKTNGTSIGPPTIRNLEKNIYKVRVLDSRFFFLRDDNTFVLLSHFIKNSQKTPEKEKNIAKKRTLDYYNSK